MRDVWRKRLALSYSEEELLLHPEARVAKVLGVFVSELYELEESILESLDISNFGVSWWVGAVPTKWRILIGDYLLQSVGTIQKNLVEAKLHLLGVQQGLDGENDRFHKTRFSGSKDAVFGKPENPMDELSAQSTDFHIAGFFRAIASVLDCLAAAVIGILGVDLRISKADWRGLASKLEKYLAGQSSDIQKKASQELLDAVDSSGPSGWIDWLLGMRNMYVHRPRQLNIRVTQGTGGVVFLPGQRLTSPQRLWE